MGRASAQGPTTFPFPHHFRPAGLGQHEHRALSELSELLWLRKQIQPVRVPGGVIKAGVGRRMGPCCRQCVGRLFSIKYTIFIFILCVCTHTHAGLFQGTQLSPCPTLITRPKPSISPQNWAAGVGRLGLVQARTRELFRAPAWLCLQLTQAASQLGQGLGLWQILTGT